MRKRSRLTVEEANEFRAIFVLYDSDNSGTVDLEEFIAAMKGPGSSGVMSEREIAECLMRFDKDGNMELDFDEFVSMLSQGMHV